MWGDVKGISRTFRDNMIKANPDGFEESPKDEDDNSPRRRLCKLNKTLRGMVKTSPNLLHSR